jgi:hypothetical protein
MLCRIYSLLALGLTIVASSQKPWLFAATIVDQAPPAAAAQGNPQPPASNTADKKKADDKTANTQSGGTAAAGAPVQQTSTTSQSSPQGTNPPKRKSAPAPRSTYVQQIVALKPASAGTVLNAADIVKAMGNPAPFTLTAAGNNAIVISSSKRKLTKADSELLKDLILHIAELRSVPQASRKKITPAKTVPVESLELYIPHATALGDMAKKIKALNYKDKGIQVDLVGTDKIRITPGSNVSDETFADFLNDLNHLAWQVRKDSPVARVFYIKASDAKSAMEASSQPRDTEENAPPPSGANDGNNAAGSTDQPATDGTTKDDGAAGTKDTNKTQNAKTSTPKNTASNMKKTKPAGKNARGADKGSGNAGKKIAGTDKKKTQATQIQDPPANGDPLAPSGSDPTGNDPGKNDDPGKNNSGNSSLTVTTVNDDVVVMSGDGAQMGKAKRILAAVDFPRPEVIINTWSFQASSSDAKTVQVESETLRRAVGQFNDSIQLGINRAWNYLQQATTTVSDFFDPDFYKYLTNHYVADSEYSPGSIERLTEGPAFMKEREKFGICPATQYCLGYTNLFRPLRPTLTDMLFAVISANDPEAQIREAIGEMDNLELTETDYERILSVRPCDKADRAAISTNSTGPALVNELLSSLPTRSHVPAEIDKVPANKVPMFCFWQEVNSEFPDNGRGSRAGLLRAAIANFLFHYKMAEQFPREFSSYDLGQSAQELNSELNPLILAFNRDLAAFLALLGEGAEQTSASKNGHFGFAGHGTRFINNGIITVRTISGKETTVDTVTQSFFDATNPPSVTDVINSIGSAQSNLPGPLKANLTANQAATIIGALNSVTPAQSKIGREFKIDITPRSLSGASSAELEINMTTQEQGEPTLYSNGKSDNDNISRVAQHNIQTKVRLESIKLFEISSFSAFLERSRRNFPLVLPFMELPLIGSFVSLPLPGGKEYHRSTAVMSAIVVPTAADLANGLRFTADRVVVPTTDPYGANTDLCASSAGGQDSTQCVMRTAVSISDLGYSITAYHKAKIACLGAEHSDPSSPASPFGSNLHCDALNLKELPQDLP